MHHLLANRWAQGREYVADRAWMLRVDASQTRDLLQWRFDG
ncbi:hypothetical protein [Xanthomonas nasturtii]|nr:hypothetical protein [Xanthomonas nasturtii]